MSHIENIPHILQYGITHKNSPSANKNYITIGDVSLIDVRSNRVVSIDNGNILNYGSANIILGDLIPFYFGIKMPMLYVMQHGGNFVEKPTPAENIIYLVCNLASIIGITKHYYFTDGHATDNLTSFYDDSKIKDLNDIIDWNAIKEPYWGGQENLNLKRKKQAEFLVLETVPVDFIVGFGCYNETAKNKLLSFGIQEEKIKIISYAYY